MSGMISASFAVTPRLAEIEALIGVPVTKVAITTEDALTDVVSVMSVELVAVTELVAERLAAMRWTTDPETEAEPEMLVARATDSAFAAVRAPVQEIAEAICTMPAKVMLAVTAAEAVMAVERATCSALPAVIAAETEIALERATASVLAAVSVEVAEIAEARATASLEVALTVRLEVMLLARVAASVLDAVTEAEALIAHASCTDSVLAAVTTREAAMAVDSRTRTESLAVTEEVAAMFDAIEPPLEAVRLAVTAQVAVIAVARAADSELFAVIVALELIADAMRIRTLSVGVTDVEAWMVAARVPASVL